jgi:hypothetical protein
MVMNPCTKQHSHMNTTCLQGWLVVTPALEPDTVDVKCGMINTNLEFYMKQLASEQEAFGTAAECIKSGAVEASGSTSQHINQNIQKMLVSAFEACSS